MWIILSLWWCWWISYRNFSTWLISRSGARCYRTSAHITSRCVGYIRRWIADRIRCTRGRGRRNRNRFIFTTWHWYHRKSWLGKRSSRGSSNRRRSRRIDVFKLHIGKSWLIRLLNPWTTLFLCSLFSCEPGSVLLL